ncbi:efflux RND transporter periplasmic adaptor subunit [Acidobacteria bacterium AH-259-O06]|nr:efflux RND transporter periplasmic adaptor subunit [Acidobacteria bacterium AH-259-O06]
MFVLFLVSPLLMVFSVVSSEGQNGDAPLIRFTQVRAHRINQSVQLPGTVQSQLVSTVASQIAGLVEEFPVREGQEVEQGQVLAQLRRRSFELRLRAEEAQLREDEAHRMLAERTLERARDLFDRGVYSRQQLDDALFEFNAWEGRVERLRAEIEQLKDDIDRTTIRAPYGGVVVSENTQVGEWMEEGGAVVELLSREELEVALDLPERYFGALRLHSRARITFEALPGLEIKGVVRTIIPRADSQARTFPIKLSIPNRQGRIGIGMLAAVTLPIGNSYTSLIVPKDAVITRGEERFVFVLNEDDSVRRTTVQTGTGVGIWVEVQGAIQEGQKVVTRGNERLDDGQKVSAELLEYSTP